MAPIETEALTHDLRQTRDLLEQIALVHQAISGVDPSSLAHARLASTRDYLASLLPEPRIASHPAAQVAAGGREFSGPVWVSRFAGSASPDACIDPFRSNLKAFLDALATARAGVSVSATYRPPERAYLMHWSWKIARNITDPRNAVPMPGVDIDWVHLTDAGAPDIAKSRSAASQMVSLYGIVAQPALVSRHTEGRAVDMNISWNGPLTIAGPKGGKVTISIEPRTGMNPELAQVGAMYGVMKARFANDPPHWSDDGH